MCRDSFRAADFSGSIAGGGSELIVVDSCNAVRCESTEVVKTTMSFSQFYNSVFQRLESLDFNQVALLVLVIVAFGFYCLRGFGSRHDY